MLLSYVFIPWYAQIKAFRSRNRKIVSRRVKSTHKDQGLFALSIASPAAVVRVLPWQLMPWSDCVHHSIVRTYISTYSVTCAEPLCMVH